MTEANGTETVQITSASDDGEHSESFASLLEQGLSNVVATALDVVFKEGRLKVSQKFLV